MKKPSDYILIGADERIRIGLSGSLAYTMQKFGLTFEYLTQQKDEDGFHYWKYKIYDHKKFMLACIQYEIVYKS
jgi:hypothetical protein